MDIITLHPDDWARYRALRLEALRTEPQAFGSAYADQVHHPESFWRWRLAQAAENQADWLLFAQEDGQLIGMINGHVGAEPGIVDIFAMYVTPARRGRGVAGALLQAVLHIARQQEGLRTARLHVNAGQTAALRLYQRAGFVITRTETERMGDGQLYPVHYLEKSLRSDQPQ
jgi:ribosomal protein S18 acetylase RimI-like enzyme